MLGTSVPATTRNPFTMAQSQSHRNAVLPLESTGDPGGTEGGGGGGAARRRKIADEKRPASPGPMYLIRRTKTSSPSAAALRKKGGAATVVSGSRRAKPPGPKELHLFAGVGRCCDDVDANISMRSVARVSERIAAAGVSGVSASAGLLFRPARSPGGWALAGGGGGGAGLVIGSSEEAALVSERKVDVCDRGEPEESRERHPGPTLDDVGRGSSWETFGALRMDRRSPNLVSPSICIGAREDAKDAQTLKEIGVTHALNCAAQLPNAHPRDFVYERLELMDTPDQELAPFHKLAVRFLQHVEKCGGRALVHCVAGCSRSVAVVLLHLMETHRIRLKVAYSHVRQRRMVAEPNEGFRFQLAMTEVQLFGSSSVSRDPDRCWDFFRWNAMKQTVPHYHVKEPPTCSCSVG